MTRTRVLRTVFNVVSIGLLTVFLMMFLAVFFS
jgi:hypothetical protein